MQSRRSSSQSRYSCPRSFRARGHPASAHDSRASGKRAACNNIHALGRCGSRGWRGGICGYAPCALSGHQQAAQIETVVRGNRNLLCFMRGHPVVSLADSFAPALQLLRRDMTFVHRVAGMFLPYQNHFEKTAPTAVARRKSTRHTAAA
mgnify:CR=1 FL=1